GANLTSSNISTRYSQSWRRVQAIFHAPPDATKLVVPRSKDICIADQTVQAISLRWFTTESSMESWRPTRRVWVFYEARILESTNTKSMQKQLRCGIRNNINTI